MKGHVNQCRKTRGNEALRVRITELERLNRQAPVITIVEYKGLEMRFEIYQPRRKGGK